MKKPKISVIMPVYNAERFIDQAMESILNQTYTGLELLIIDDCSTDSTMENVNRHTDSRIRIIHNPQNMGIAYSRNEGIRNSTGEYIALMDNDDVAMPERLEKQAAFLQEHPKIDVVGGQYQYIDENGEPVSAVFRSLHNPHYVRASLMFKNIFCNSEVTFRRSMVDKHRIWYQDNCLGMEDYLFWIQYSQRVLMSGIEELFLLHRKRLDNESGRVRREQAEERKKLFAQLQKYSIYENGFRLSEGELAVLTKVICEGQAGRIESEAELKQFYMALAELVRQADQMNSDNREEIRILCKQILVEKIRKMENLFRQ